MDRLSQFRKSEEIRFLRNRDQKAETQTKYWPYDPGPRKVLTGLFWGEEDLGHATVAESSRPETGNKVKKNEECQARRDPNHRDAWVEFRSVTYVLFDEGRPRPKRDLDPKRIVTDAARGRTVLSETSVSDPEVDKSVVSAPGDTGIAWSEGSIATQTSAYAWFIHNSVVCIRGRSRSSQFGLLQVRSDTHFISTD